MSRFRAGRRYVRFIMAFTAGLLLFALPLAAQTSTGNIYGTVADSSGAPLPGVTVTINAGGLQQTFVTESDGAFRFLRLPTLSSRISSSTAPATAPTRSSGTASWDTCRSPTRSARACRS